MWEIYFRLQNNGVHSVNQIQSTQGGAELGLRFKLARMTISKKCGKIGLKLVILDLDKTEYVIQ